MPVYNIRSLYTKKRRPCKGRKLSGCKTSKKKCLWAKGTKRSFCRKRKVTRRR
jgi:hypothetical protein